MTKEKAIQEMNSLKRECVDAYFRFKEFQKCLKKISKKADKLYYELDNPQNKELYKTEVINYEDGKSHEWTHSDGWNETVISRLSEISEWIPKSIEAIDACLSNMKNTPVHAKRIKKEGTKKK